MATSKEMTAGPALPLIFNFTLPLLFGNLLQQTYSLVDAAIVGKFLGINALASVGASTSVVFLILGFCNGCCGGFGMLICLLLSSGYLVLSFIICCRALSVLWEIARRLFISWYWLRCSILFSIYSVFWYWAGE